MATIRVQPPLGGVVRRTAFQSQPPFTLSDATNFWPKDARSGRDVLATRPFLGAFASPGVGTGLGVNMLVRVNGTGAQSPQRTILSALDGSLYRWDGTQFVLVATTPAITADRPVFATPFLQQVAICVDTTAPLLYDYPTNTLSTLTATAGTVPLDTRVCATWQGALWLAGARNNPNVISCSRTGNITDWDFLAPIEDTGGAFTLVGEQEGLIGEPVTALAPHTDDSMIVGGEDTLWAFRGHPRRGGIFEQVSNATGIIGQGAWTKSPENVLYFLGLDGLYALPPQPGAAPTLVSDKIPNELRGLDYDMYNPVANLEYDTRFEGIHITFRGSQSRSWWYDVRTGGFWNMAFLDYPVVTIRFDIVETGLASGALYGGRGVGGMARLDLNSTSELGWVYGCKIGPIKLSPNMREKSIIQAAAFALDFLNDTNDDITFAFYTGATGEDAYARAQQHISSHRFEKTSGFLRQNGFKCYPRIGGHAMVLDIVGGTANTSQLVLDDMDMEVRATGKNRMSATHRVAEIPLGGGIIGVGGACFTDSHGNGASFDPTGWSLYVEHTLNLVQPVGNMGADMSYLIDMSLFPDLFWDNVKADGGDIRVTNTFNTRLAVDLVKFNKGAKTGLLAVRMPECYSTMRFRVYAGNASATLPANTDTFGRFNAYDPNMLAFWTLEDSSDRGQFEWDLFNLGDTPTFAGTTGPAPFVSGTPFVFTKGSTDEFLQSLNNAGTPPVPENWSIMGWHRRAALPSLVNDGGGFADYNFYMIRDPSNGTLRNYIPSKLTFTAWDTIQDDIHEGSKLGGPAPITSEVITGRSTAYQHFAMTDNESNLLTLYRNGVDVADTNSYDASPSTSAVVIGRHIPGVNIQSSTQDLSLLFWYAVELLPGFIALHEAQVRDQAGYYGTWVGINLI